ncbi:histone-lysine N-methyltransferase MLL4 [Clonorchis sinensis]|uniref:Histone-lysine N-methyltransferase MLL4 n=1 Tax=Clonorchis sinensis TaxID=79923 RepID=G7YBI0_CLOSI|nr:histone-lysine N-methyltransferase MLL4 [Clonorchis sinensis]
MREHNLVSLSGRWKKPGSSAIASHLAEINHVIDKEQAFTIIYQAPPNRSRLHRFLDDYDGNLSCLTGQGRRIRDESCGSRGSNSSVSSRASGSSILTRRTYSSRASLLAQKRAHACLNNRGRTTVVSRSNAGSSKGRSNLLDDAPCPEEATNLSDKSVEEPSRVCGVGPRVKQISRPAIKSEESRYTSALSAMVHAARLAAVGAKVPGGTSPKHAALAATARSNVDDLGDTNRTDISSMSQDRSPTTVVGRSDFAQSLPDRCGQCPACCGLVQPCGVCNNCRSLQEIDKGGSEMKRRPCKELICFRRRPTHVSFKSGPRVKLPSNFPSNGSGPAASSHCQKASEFGEQQPVQHEFISPTKQQEAKWTHGTVSLLDTVPGLAQQLDCDAWVNQPMNSRNGCAPKIRPKDFFKLPKRANQLEVFSSHPVTPIPGGDLGMRFSGQSFVDVGDVDEDRIRPVEGEVITSELAHHGGYAVVTTMASAPPKEICYACGSGGGQLLFCVSCAEPFHFYCVERQFRPRRKDHFICRNCTECKECHSPAADLRCIRCSAGYHPSCLSDYAPAQSVHRGNWVCPHCASCVHCGSKPLHKRQEAGTETGKPPNTGGCSRSTTAWSSEPNKCAACCSAEARGDICPECDRAYLPTTKQMIQCDTCQLWMHRTCTKLTADEYEWIARLSPGQLNKFIVNCKVCQNELNQRNRADETQGKNTSTSNEPTQRDLGDTDKLQALAHDTLLERMADLVTSCRRSSVTDSSSPTCPPPPPPQSALHTSPQQSTVLSPTVFPPKKPSTGPDPRFPRIPQVDGIVDEDSEDGASPLVQPDSSTYMHIGAHASDVLFYEQNPQPLSDISSFCPLDTFGKPRRGPSNFIRKDKCRTERLRTFSGGSHVTSSARLTPPPICANWVTESEAQRAWTTPRSLVYRILTRILHRLAAHPINSPHAVALRQLLRWFSCTIESLFPWLIVSEMANDVRDLLQQTGSELTAVLRHFEKCALIELYELMCPIAARMSDAQIHSSMCASKSWQRVWNSVSRVQNCFSVISHHLKTHHPDSMSLAQKLPPKLVESRHILAAKAALARLSSSHCYRPHELEAMERMRNEAREERWVEHWSAIEEQLVLKNFQRHLLRDCPSGKPNLTVVDLVDHQSPQTTDPDGLTVNPPESGMDEKTICPAFENTQFRETPEMRPDSCESPISENVAMESKQPLVVHDNPRGDQFYFALEDCWSTAVERTAPNASCDADSSDEDVRSCLLCGRHGDDNIEGRLLFTGADTWVHVNCALWSNEVFEEETGQLVGLSDALRRGRESVCLDCGQYGATLLCSNSHEPMCTLYMQPWLTPDDSASPSRLDVEMQKSVHFACALRRRPPAPRSIFTADRSWFCSPECHQAAIRQRLTDAIQSRKDQQHHKSSKSFDAQLDCTTDEETLTKGAYAMLENAVADDLEPISLGELLVCRRVFAPSDCFAVSLLPPTFHRQPNLSTFPDDNPGLLRIARRALSNLSASPNSLAFLQCTGLPAASLVITIGSLRVDRLGEVREASDSLAITKRSSSPELCSLGSHLCPINYRLPQLHTQPVRSATCLFPASEPLKPTSPDPPTRIAHQLIPQLDGTLDEDDKSDYSSKRSRSMFRQYSSSRRRSASATSNDSSSSNRTTASNASKAHRRSHFSPVDHLKQHKQSQPPPVSLKALPAKRKWIEERNRQQELAHLVSKAKLANHARMYQHEVEKHARAFRLRFSIDGCVRAAPNPAVAWRSILTRVAVLREKQGLPPLLYGGE